MTDAGGARPGGPPETIYLIRHGEKPPDPPGTPAGIDAKGSPNPHSLTPRGWQRSGAIGMLFTRSGTPGPALRVPDRLLCPDYGDKTLVHRTYQTLLGIAGLLGLDIESPVADGAEARLVRTVLARDAGTVLICWEHHRIPDIAAALPVTGDVPVPAAWPGDRFDLIWQFRRVATNGGSAGYTFQQLPQHVLSGDRVT